jgi:hypothetical protein
MRTLERQALLADQQAVRDLLARLPESDPLGRMSLEARLRDIEAQLAKLEATPDTVGSVALIFGGAPVQGSRSIAADFSTRAIHEFQDLVAKRLATEESGKLGSRGPIPLRSVVNLGITDLLRGSIGFVLEETGPNHELAPTNLKKAIDDVARMVAATAAESAEEFEGTLEAFDERLLVSLRDFFRTLDEKRATLRIVESEREVQLDAPAVHRGRERIDALQITEEESDTVIGELLGLLPGSRRFELKLSNGEVIKGGVAPDVGPRYLELIGNPNQVPVGRIWRTKMRMRVIQQRSKVPRTLYTLVELIERMS